MTTLQDAPAWVSPAAYRKLNGLPPRALVAASPGHRFDAMGRRHWDPLKHPRGRDGRFIETGGEVKVFDALRGGNVVGTGIVEKIDAAGIHVRFENVHGPNGAAMIGQTRVFQRQQIATIPHGAVRLDRNGNVHPNDRELPDKHGKLVRPGDRVRTPDGEGVVRLVGENGGVAITHDDGRKSARKIENVERLDHPNPAQVRPHEREAHARLTGEHAARRAAPEATPNSGNRFPGREAPAVPAPAAPAAPAAPVAPAAPAAPRDSLEHRLARWTPGFNEQIRDMDVGRYTLDDLRPGGQLHDRVQSALEESGTPRDHITIKIPSGSEISIPRDIAEYLNGGPGHRPAGDGEAPVRDGHGNTIPSGWTRDDLGVGESYTRDGYRVQVTAERRPGGDERKVYRVSRLDHNNRPVENIGTVDKWEVPDGRSDAPFMIDNVTELVRNDREHHKNVVRLDRADAERRATPSRDKVRAALEHFHARPDTIAAARHGGNDELRRAIASDNGLRDRLRVAQEDARGRDVRQPHQRQEEDHLDVLNRAQRHGVAGEPEPRPVSVPAAPAVPSPAPAIPDIPNVRLPDDEHFKAAEVVQMLRELPVHVGGRAPTLTNERYLRNVRLSMQDMLTAPRPEMRAIGSPDDARVTDYFRRALEGRDQRGITAVKIAEIRDRWNAMRAGGGNRAEARLPSTPDAPAAPDVPAPRTPRVQPGVVGQGAYANATLHDLAGNTIGVGHIVKLPNGDEGYVARVHPPSGRVVVRNPHNGLQVMRLAETVRLQYNDDGGRNRPVQRPNAPAAPAAPVVPDARVNVDPDIGMNLQDLRLLRDQIPKQLANIPGHGDDRKALWRAGFALGDVLDRSKPVAERQAALQRALTQLQLAKDRGVPGGEQHLARLRGLLGQAPSGPKPLGPVRPSVPRPVDPQALNPSATWRDYADEWGHERGESIARAARERPSLDTLRNAAGNDAKLAVAKRIFDGEYGNNGITLKTTDAGGGAMLIVQGRVLDKDGNEIGSWTRHLMPDGVYNAYFRINGDQQASGMASEFNRHMEDWYIANGIKQVTVSAAMDRGGYAWARNGFDWNNQGRDIATPRAIAAGVARVAERMGDAEAQQQAADIIRRMDNHRVEDPEFPTPFEVSQVGYKVGMGRHDEWAGKQGMFNVHWSGIKKLDPTARAYQQQVTAGRLPDPAVKTLPPLGPHSIPDALRQISIADLMRATPQKGSTAVIGDFTFKRAKQSDTALLRGEDAGKNTAWLVTHNGTGERFIVKRDTIRGRAGADAEVAASQVLLGIDYHGASYVEVHPSDEQSVISTWAGAREGTSRHTVVKGDPRLHRPAEIYANMADPSELMRARVFNVATMNFDRHGGNAFWGKGPDGKDHLLLFDHGLALNPQALAFTQEFVVNQQLCGYGPVFGQHLQALSEADTVSQIREFAQELLNVVNGQSWPSEVQRQSMITRLQAILADPDKLYRQLRARHNP